MNLKMEQKKLANLLKLICIGLAVIGAVVYFIVLPTVGRDLVEDTGLVRAFWPWLLFLWGTGIPCYMALFEFWHVCGEIYHDNSFCEDNAVRMMNIALLILGDVAYFFAGNVVYLLLNMNHPAIFLVSLAVDVFGVGIGVAAAALSHLVYKAAVMQAENDLTV